MSNMPPLDDVRAPTTAAAASRLAPPDDAARRSLIGLAAASAVFWATRSTDARAAVVPHIADKVPAMPSDAPTSLTPRQLAIGPIAAATAQGNMPALALALNTGLDAGLTVSELKEVLVQLYAYAGFPRALNALGAFMKTLEDRKRQGLRDAPGREPGPVPTGASLLEHGTANQTRLSGAPVRGPLFDFAPAIDQFLKTHLFGDIFERDNLDWSSRELATVAALSALTGVEAQLQAHVRISLNVGLTLPQLRLFAGKLAAQGQTDAAGRLAAALDAPDVQRKV